MGGKPSSFGVLFEGAAYALEGLAWFGAVSGTALFIFLGKLLIAAVFLLFMAGVVIRIRRGRVHSRRAIEENSGA